MGCGVYWAGFARLIHAHFPRLYRDGTYFLFKSIANFTKDCLSLSESYSIPPQDFPRCTKMLNVINPTTFECSHFPKARSVGGGLKMIVLIRLRP
jgi:hypothetical protein